MNDFVREDGLTTALDGYRQNMVLQSNPVFQAGCEALRQQMLMATASTLLAEVENTKAAFARTIYQQLPAPPTPLHVESETLPMDERIEKEIDWRRFASSARGHE
jgi:hypothetical protein